jgi:hypothetical protein
MEGRGTMYYEGKFRDFMAGWLALQLEGSAASRREVEALYYDAVVYADNDGAAFTEVEAVLGKWAARMLWNLSERCYDPSVEMARGIIEALRESVQEYSSDPTEFYLFFLNPFKDGCVPAGFEEAVERKICWMFRVFYSTAGEMVLAPKGWEPYVVVEPSYEGASDVILLAHPKEETYDKVFVLQDWYKAWHLRFASLRELAEELLNLRQAIERCATEAILRYRLAKTVTEVLGEGWDFNQAEALFQAYRPP